MRSLLKHQQPLSPPCAQTGPDTQPECAASQQAHHRHGTRSVRWKGGSTWSGSPVRMESRQILLIIAMEPEVCVGRVEVLGVEVRQTKSSITHY